MSHNLRLPVQTNEQVQAKCSRVEESSVKLNARCKMLVKPFIPSISEFLVLRNKFHKFWNKKSDAIVELLPNIFDTEFELCLLGKLSIISLEFIRKRIQSYDDSGNGRRRLEPPKIFYDYKEKQWKKKTISVALDDYVNYVFDNVDVIENVSEGKMKKALRKQISAGMNEIFSQLKAKEKDDEATANVPAAEDEQEAENPTEDEPDGEEEPNEQPSAGQDAVVESEDEEEII